MNGLLSRPRRASQRSLGRVVALPHVEKLALVVQCPEIVLSEASSKHSWASEFSTILVPQKLGILGTAGILGRQRKRVPKHKF